ncbi:TIGR02646 family protein [Roseovarius pacificus]|uniref:TIGR02646 family protein n=1 Tax=Roseovarius pacificus TaxID=337701 RepID=A0A1M7KKC7_9RHOB|nr:HNH endonuclease [Roseovarius pacificus]GGO62807.1 hypothetical protein GCM10011315_42670 [Roseovarius pacificus]SHM65387.1 TIGR02646 family protein [Roseovarius pacificus]
MRNLTKAIAPAVIADNEQAWLEQLAEEPDNATRKTRYRHPEIKAAIRDEAYNKCIYCESKLGHNTPGDVEHIKPSSTRPHLRFNWRNLGLACTECNRRKGVYDNDEIPFLNPFEDDVEARVLHYGPIMSWVNGDQAAEIAIRKLELHGYNREQLVIRKIERIHEVDRLMTLYQGCGNEVLKEMYYLQLIDMAELPSEFSGMVKSILERNGIL